MLLCIRGFSHQFLFFTRVPLICLCSVKVSSFVLVDLTHPYFPLICLSAIKSSHVLRRSLYHSPTLSHSLLFISTPSLPCRLSPPWFLSSLIYTSVLTPLQVSCPVSSLLKAPNPRCLYTSPVPLNHSEGKANDFDRLTWKADKQNWSATEESN